MSINHNWCNGNNILAMLDYYKQCRLECEQEIKHLIDPTFSLCVQEWQEEVERLLAQHYGMNTRQFIEMLYCVEEKLRIAGETSFSNWQKAVRYLEAQLRMSQNA